MPLTGRACFSLDIAKKNDDLEYHKKFKLEGGGGDESNEDVLLIKYPRT